MKTIAIHQPNYIPWPGYFYKIHQSDVFVFLDDVQYSNQGMHNYHFIKTRKGPVRLKVPVVQSFGDKISGVRMRETLEWRNNHLNQLHENYRKSSYFEEVISDFEELLSEKHEFLPDLNIRIIEFICSKLGITYNFIRSSELNISTVKEEKVLDICNALNGDIYLSGTGARAYQEEENFNKRGLDLIYSEYSIVEYPQQHEDFQANSSILDYLFNCGYNWTYILDKQKK